MRQLVGFDTGDIKSCDLSVQQEVTDSFMMLSLLSAITRELCVRTA